MDLLDDHVASAHGGHDLLRLDADVREGSGNGFADERGVHHFAFDDCVRREWYDAGAQQLGLTPGVVDDCHLYMTRPDIEADRRLLATEECHGECWVRCTREESREGWALL